MSRLFELALPAAVLVALPVVGLVAGPAYAPLVFGLGAAQFLWRALREGHMPRPDAAATLLALLFAGLCFLSAAWSIAPARTLRGAVQMTALFAGVLIFLAQPAPAATRLLRAMALAWLAGGALIAADTSLSYPLARALTGSAANAATKYNRGLDYALLLAWPVLGGLAGERAWRFVAALGCGLALMLVFGLSLTARLAAVAAFLALLLSSFAPRLVGAFFAAGTALFALFSPLLLGAAATYRASLAPYLKQSGAVRLEIWDYMTARAFERPGFGWGFWSARSLPIRPSELSHYLWVGRQGFYPHDQWLQAWVELGAPGALLVLLFAWLALKRVGGLPSGLRPFGYAAFAAAAATSLADFDLATDSWWAALASCCYLFKTASFYARPDALRPRSSAAKE